MFILIYFQSLVSYAQELPDLSSFLDIQQDTTANTFPPEYSDSFTGQNFENLPWKNSVMFPRGAITQLYSALNSRTLGTRSFVNIAFPGKSGDPTTRGQATPEGTPSDAFKDTFAITTSTDPSLVTPTVAPAFHLNSILFYTPENWTIWVNRRRIRRNTKLNRLEIGKITQSYVEFIWHPLNINVLSPNWLTTVSPIGDGGILEEIQKDVKENQENSDMGEESQTEVGGKKEVSIDNIFEGSEEDSFDDNMEPLVEIKRPDDHGEIITSLELPLLYTQEDFSMNLVKITTLLKEETTEIMAKERAEEVIKTAETAENKYKLGKKEKNMVFDAYKDREIPFLWEYTSDNGDVLIDSINGVVKFRLGINQTFVSRSMVVVEGFVKSTMLASATQEVEELGTQDLEKAVFQYNNSQIDNKKKLDSLLNR